MRSIGRVIAPAHCPDVTYPASFGWPQCFALRTLSFLMTGVIATLVGSAKDSETLATGAAERFCRC